MRKVFVIAALTAIAVAGTVATANAQRVTKFSVVAVGRHAHRIDHSFVVGGVLKEVGESQIVGRYKAKFTPRSGHRVRIRANAFFRNEGLIKVKGIEGPGDNRLNVIGGTGAFNGASGKLITHGLSRNRTLLTFTIVQ
jgi:hypothetical protein